MAKLTDIKHRIDQMDGGAFQNLCDAYLKCMGYGTGYSLGMNTGSNKTAKGNPDTYFLTADRKYIFAMYTTQKTNFVQKAKEDISKCFDSKLTGVPSTEVKEIVYCHTYGRLSPGEHRELCKLCEERNVVLSLIGLDDLGNDLYLKYPRIAKDYLGVTIDTGQITSMREFVLTHDANKMSAPLDTGFLFRDEELKTAKEKLCQSNALIVSGPSGAGKTRFALKLCEEYSIENDCEVLCIKSNGLELFEDLTISLEDGKDYLVFVDDANELAGLHFVLNYLSRAETGKKYIKKVVITVRDYARQQVVNQVLEVEKPEILKIELLKDEDIRKLMEASFGITNDLYLDRIVAIAEGNARLAMLAGRVAAETEKLDSIRDASELYDSYYGKQIETILNNETGLASAGIMAFFQVLHLNHLERLDAIFATIRITRDQFISDLKQLHEMELVDLCHDTAARIADQSFSNYLIKHIFIDRKIISLSQMIENGFFINQERTVTACNILLYVFSDVRVQNYVEQQINLVWDRLQNDIESFFPFFKAFHMIRPTETLLIIKELIDKETYHRFDIHSIPFKKTEAEKGIDDDIINILCSFEHHSQLAEAVDLLLLYYQRRPDLFEQVYSALVSRLGVNKDSHRYGYFAQKTVVERLCIIVKTIPTEENLLLFVRVAEQYLKLSFSKPEGGRQHTFIFYTMPLTMNDSVLEYRSMLLRQLLEMYESGKCCGEIEGLLMDYCKAGAEKIDYEIVKRELESVLQFFSLFSTDSLYHCVIAEHIQNVAKRAGYDCKNAINLFFESPKYKIYYALKVNYQETINLSIEDGEDFHRKRVQEFVQDYDFYGFEYLLQVCKECLQTVDPDARELSFGLECVIDSFSTDQELYIDVVKAYLTADTPYDIHANAILQKLFEMLPAEEVKELIVSHDFAQKNAWLWCFYIELPEDQISDSWAEDFLEYLRMPSGDLRRSPYRRLDKIERYECIDNDIILKASRIIAERFEESPFVFSLYFFFMINSLHMEATRIITKYESDIPLLEDIYLKYITYSENEDSHGEFLAEIVKRDSEFLNRYLEEVLKKSSHFYSIHETWVKRLEFIWKLEIYMSAMDKVSDYILERNPEIYRFVIRDLLTYPQGNTDIEVKQEKWIRNTIERYCFDSQRMYRLFSSIAEHSADRRRGALKRFLELNNDYTLFEQLPLEASSWGGYGSMIPYMQERITYLTSLLPMLSGLEFLRHKQRVEQDIEIWRIRIREEEIEELLESMG